MTKPRRSIHESTLRVRAFRRTYYLFTVHYSLNRRSVTASTGAWTKVGVHKNGRVRASSLTGATAHFFLIHYCIYPQTVGVYAHIDRQMYTQSKRSRK